MAALPIISLVAGAVGTAVSAIGAISSSQSQAAAANYQAQVARNNQIIASQNAEYATRVGNEKATQQSLAARSRLASVRAGEAASNIDVNTGSAADVQAGQAEAGTLDTNQTVANAALTAYGYKTQATNFGAEAGLESAQAGFDTTAGYLAAGSDLLSGASSLGTKWQQFQNQAGSAASGL